jgi:hypothetical protein
MKRSRKWKIALLVAGGLMLLLIAVVVIACCRPEPIPLRVVEVKEGDRALAATRGQRLVSITVHNELDQHVIFGNGWNDVSYSYRIKTGGGTMEVSHPLQIPGLGLQKSSAAGSVYQIAILMPNEVEAVSLELRYRIGDGVHWPFGIGDPRARYLPPSKASDLLQRVTRAISRSLYDKLWPNSSKETYHWRNASLQVAVPKFTAPGPADGTTN